MGGAAVAGRRVIVGARFRFDGLDEFGRVLHLQAGGRQDDVAGVAQPAMLWLAAASTRVLPSGVARATCDVPTVPPAPARFSTTMEAVKAGPRSSLMAGGLGAWTAPGP
ncbi:hypothetical protein G6F50_018016 [Rhizopus delemar]|uniref:Uncharacterized protein n=1 Tax=Rhizopus delemar TaxID=936053 RepID=A0A9P6XP11_9FUNG|nr:hypothetical protein G6F50_018016 [Rhizopus delemar]